ncbi:MAG: FAD-dependent oxidoreductase [Oleiphilaceae bacterium]|nr:FAD-dependent oxidoreductase [Oleiphilaceae bacterium]
MPLPPIRRVAIIGSGMAGLTMAISLQAQGIEVTVLEKSRGPGGRLASKRVPGGSVDIGAQFFTIRNEAFRQFLDQYAGRDSYRQWTGVLFHEQQPGLPTPYHAAQRYVGVPRMTAVSRALSRHVPVQYQIRADRVVRMQQQWQILEESGHSHGPFDGVVITAPPEQARELVRELPQVKQALQDFAMLPTWSLAMKFREPLRLSFDGMSLKDGLLGWVARDASKPERDSGEWWVVHASSDWSEAHQDDDAPSVEAAMTRAFAERFSHGQTPESVVSHRWLYARPASSETDSGFAAFQDSRLAFCGDWLNGGRVEGAWESADALIRHWRESGLLLSQHGG